MSDLTRPVATARTQATDAPAPARVDGRGVGYWGMVMLIATESIIFLGLIATYFFLRASSPRCPDLGWIWLFSILLWSSSLPVWWGERELQRGHPGRLRIGLLLGFALGAAFVGHSIYEYQHLDFSITENAYASIFYTTTGLHLAHVVFGLIMSGVVQAKTWKGRITPERHVSLQVFALYWHFVDAVWVFVFFSLYVSEHLR